MYIQKAQKNDVKKKKKQFFYPIMFYETVNSKQNYVKNDSRTIANKEDIHVK